LADGTEQDTDDNSADFELDTPTPGTQNITFVAPTPTPTPTPTPSPAPPSIITYTISNLIISPNGDGVDDTTSIDLAFSESVKAEVDIIDSKRRKS